MFSEQATGDTPDEQPGAMPEIFPSAPNGDPKAGIPPNIDRCWTCRSMFMQAWGNYGTAWSVMHQQLGVRPFLNDSELQVVPQVPSGQPNVEGSNIRLGRGSVDVFAADSGDRYTTKVDARRTPVRKLLSATRCRMTHSPRASGSTAVASSITTRGRPTAGSRSPSGRRPARSTR